MIDRRRSHAAAGAVLAGARSSDRTSGRRGRLYYATTAADSATSGFRMTPQTRRAGSRPGDHRSRDRNGLPRAGARREAPAPGATSGRCADRRAERRSQPERRRSRWPTCSRCGGSHERRRRSCATSRDRHLIRDGARRHDRRRSGGRHRQDHRARAADPPRARERPRAHRAGRGGDVHREGGRRAEAANPQGAGEPAPAIGDAGTCRRTSPTRFSGSRRRTSAPFTASAPTCCASVRSKRASIRCSRCSPSRSAEPAVRRGVPSVVARAAGEPARGRAPRAAPQRVVAAMAATDEDGPVDRIRRAAPRAGRVARLHRARGGASRSIATLSCTRVLAPARTGRADRRAPSSTRDPLFTDTAPMRELSHDVGTAERFDAADPDGWEARVIDLAQNRDFRRARKGRERDFRTGRCRAKRSGPSYESADAASSTRFRARRTRTSRRCCTSELRAVRRRLRAR